MAGLRPAALCLLVLSGCGSCHNGSSKAGPSPRDQPTAPARGPDPATEAEIKAVVARPEAFTLEPDLPGGLRLRYYGREIGTLDYTLWRAGASPQPRPTESASDPESDDPLWFAVSSGASTPPQVTGTIREQSPAALRYEYTLKGGAATELRLEFEVSAPAELNGFVQSKPTIAGDRSGFTVPLPDAGQLQVRLSQPAQEISVVHSAPLRVQVRLPLKSTSKGTALQMTVSLSQGGRVIPPLALRLGLPDESFRAQTIDSSSAPIDLGFLNAADRPAGRHGRVQVHGSALRFADGTPARFWGVNIAAYALFYPSNGLIEQIAKRLAAFGFNLVRIHHHDSDWVKPNVFAADRPDTQTLHEPALERLDYWIKCLRDAGIYVWLDLEVGRRFRQGDDIPGWDEVVKVGRSAKAVSFVNGRVAELMEAFARDYLTHRNRYTGLRYLEDPALMAVLLTNENDLIKHGTHMADPKGFPYHQARFKAFAMPFAKAHDLPLPQALHAWEPGSPALILGALEQRFFRRGIRKLRRLGLSAPIAAGNYWGWSPMTALFSLAEGDLMDAHSYGTDSELGRDPRHVGQFLNWVVGAAVDGKPVTVTEWNTPLPTPDRADAPLFVAATAALQGWDALMVYAYLHDGGGHGAGPWNIAHDPALMATMPHAALAYRRGDVDPARKHYRLRPTSKDLYGLPTTLEPVDLRALRTLMPQSRVTIALPEIPALGYKPDPPEDGALDVTDLQRSFIPADQPFVASDTGQLRWMFGPDPRYTIDTEKTQAVLGQVGGQTVALSALSVQLTTPHAVVALSSLDDQPIANSTRLLLSTVAQAVEEPDPEHPHRSTYWAQPVTGRVGVRSEHPALRLIPLSPAGRQLSPVPGRKADDGVHWFDLPSELSTHWYTITPARTAP